jgi:hypothetical protein
MIDSDKEFLRQANEKERQYFVKRILESSNSIFLGTEEKIMYTLVSNMLLKLSQDELSCMELFFTMKRHS